MPGKNMSGAEMSAGVGVYRFQIKDEIKAARIEAT
jgi:hypothetical protein